MRRPPTPNGAGRASGNGSVPRLMETIIAFFCANLKMLLLSMQQAVGMDLANPCPPLGGAPSWVSRVGVGGPASGLGSLFVGFGRPLPGSLSDVGGGSAHPIHPVAPGAVGPSGLSPGFGDGWQGGYASGQRDSPLGL